MINLSAAFLVIFAVIGVIAFVREISYLIFKSKSDNSILFITPISGRCEDAEYMLRCAAAKVKWVSCGKNDYVICLDCNMDEETKIVCENICKEYGFVKMMSKNEFIKMLEQKNADSIKEFL